MSTPHYDPPAETVKIKQPDDLTGAELFRIKGATPVDVIRAAEEKDLTSVMFAILWHVISQRPEYRGITFSNVLEWPLSKIAMDEPQDDDAEDVRETVQDMADRNDTFGVDDGVPFTGPSEPASE